jgi:hypothetical protein
MSPLVQPLRVTGTNETLHHGKVEISLYGIYGETKENHHLRQDSHGGSGAHEAAQLNIIPLQTVFQTNFRHTYCFTGSQ